ncbi:MAG: hypothetical protein RIB84_22430 [Sneathiellaceae bacterium]
MPDIETDRVWIADLSDQRLSGLDNLDGLVGIDGAFSDTAKDGGADCTWVITPARARTFAAELVAEADRLDPPQPEDGSQA